MKTQNVLGLCLIAQMMISGTAKAAEGGSHGGGGVGVRCLTPDGKTQSFEMLDLYEAEARGLHLRPSPKNERDTINLATDLIVSYSHFPNSAESPTEMRKWATKDVKTGLEGRPEYDGKKLLRRTVFGGLLPLSNDFGPYSIASNCHLEQVAYFTDQNLTVHISRAKWKELNWLNRLALIAHEGVYFSFRERAVENFGLHNEIMTSQLARQFVGDFLSTKGVISKSDSLPPNNYLECVGSDARSSGTSLYAFAAGSGTSAVFEILASGLSPYQMKINFSGLSIQSLGDIGSEFTAMTAPLEFVGEARAPIFAVAISKQKDEPAILKVLRKESSGFVQVRPEQSLECELHY